MLFRGHILTELSALNQPDDHLRNQRNARGLYVALQSVGSWSALKLYLLVAPGAKRRAHALMGAGGL